MSQTKTGDIFKEIGGEACFVGEKVEVIIRIGLRRIKFACLNIFIIRKPVTKKRRPQIEAALLIDSNY
ncbi:MAG: hypothetical protein JWR38_1372 [Mucilaginibacter sp.]|nr:hypothetical protein [Mucilaginibacter sp.]